MSFLPLWCRRAVQTRTAAVDAATVADRVAAAAEAGLAQRRILQGLSAQRVQRLETLVELKKLYRNIIRAEALLALRSPVYTPAAGVCWQRNCNILQAYLLLTHVCVSVVAYYVPPHLEALPMSTT